MKTTTLLLAALCLLVPAALHAEEPVPVPAPLASHAESAESKPHAESAEAAEPGSPAGGAAECSEAEGVPHAAPAASRAAKPRTANPPLRAEVSLADGTLLKGSLRHRFLPAESAILGRLRIDLSSVSSIAFEPDPAAAARVAFRNGDLVTATLYPKHDRLVLDTLLGPLPIPLSAVNSISFTSSTPSTFSTPSTLLYHCTFDSPSSITRPAAGPAGRFLGGEFVPGKTGNALRIEVDKPGFDAQFSKGTLGPEGTIEFWAKIEGDDPHFFDGGDPLFFSMYNEIGSVTLLQFAQNNGFGRGGLGGAMAGWPFGTADHTGSTADYSEFLGANWADWHHYAMSWKADGFADGSFVKVFVDGKSKSLFGGVNDDKVSGALSDYGNHNYSLGSPWSPTWGPRGRCNKKSFLIDEFKIWSAPTTVFDGISIR